MNRSEMMSLIGFAIANPDDYVVQIGYKDQKHVVTRRIVSPIRWLYAKQSFEALCLCREKLRKFYLSGCRSVKIVLANEVLMPVKIEILEVGK